MFETLDMRLNYHGGKMQWSRMVSDKIRSLRKALLYSYQSGTAILPDGRKFRALFNPNNTKADYDTKMLSIPYKDVCLNKEMDIHEKTTDGIEPTDIKNGDVIVWEENNTHWLVYIEDVEEIAYFRADIRRCDQTIEIDGTEYWVYLRGPVETALSTGQKQGLVWNNLNYSEVMYITRNKQTDDFFHRYSKIKIGNIENDWEGGNHLKTWQVVSVNPYYGDGIIQVFLDEYYENSIEEARQEEIKEEEESKVVPEVTDPQIAGAAAIEIYSSNSFTIENIENPQGEWSVDSTKVAITQQTPTSVQVRVISGKSGNFNLKYTDGDKVIVKNILIQSF